jgi:hypothetical protein
VTHSKLTRSILHFIAATALGAFALTGAGCAMNAGDEATGTDEADLRKAPMTVAAPRSLSDEPESTSYPVMPKAGTAPKLIVTDRLLGPGGEDQDGPRPHPWEPTPDSTETENSGTSSSSTDTTK